MSEDETFVMVGCGVASAFAWARWYWILYRPGLRGREGRRRLSAVPLLGVGLLFVLLRAWAAEDVRHDPVYLGFYLLMGAAWVGLSRGGLPWLGVSVRDDVCERGNGAAATAIGGGIVGLTLCFAGGNFGDGPGWWVVVFAAWLATVVFYLAWFLLARYGGLAEVITIERDPAGGWRAAGFFIGVGLILGRAVAGNWVSVSATVADFGRQAWPIVLLLGLAVCLEKCIRPVADRDFAATLVAGVSPALSYAVLAAVAVLLLGKW